MRQKVFISYAHQDRAFAEALKTRLGEILAEPSLEDPLVNVGELGAHLRRKRELAHLSLRNVAMETQISASTLSRIENGTGVPDTPTLARLARWLNIPLERIVSGTSPTASAVVYYPQESIPDILEAHLRADPNLTPDSQALDVFDVQSSVGVGENIRDAIQSAMREASTVVIVSSPASDASQWVSYEAGLADALGKHMVIVGRKGAGKSALLKRLLGTARFVEVDETG